MLWCDQRPRGRDRSADSLAMTHIAHSTLCGALRGSVRAVGRGARAHVAAQLFNCDPLDHPYLSNENSWDHAQVRGHTLWVDAPRCMAWTVRRTRLGTGEGARAKARSAVF